MKTPHPNANVEIVFVPPGVERSLGDGQADRIRLLIREHLLLPGKETYRKVHVELERGPDDRLHALLVTMMRAFTYTADVVRVELDPNLRVRTIDRGPSDPSS